MNHEKKNDPKRSLKAILFLDIVNSVKLQNEMGDSEAGHMINNLFDLIDEITNYLKELYHQQYIKIMRKEGDSCWVAFESTIMAFHFALFAQNCSILSHQNDNAQPHPPGFQNLHKLPAFRIGIYVGDICSEENSDNPQNLDISIANRIMSLASKNQILCECSIIANKARELEKHFNQSIEIYDHGDYYIKHTDIKIKICEIGFSGIAPNLKPKGNEKIYPAVNFQRKLSEKFKWILLFIMIVVSGFTIVISKNTNIHSKTNSLKTNSVYFPYNGHYYKRLDVPTTWKQGKKICEQANGYLVTIASPSENQFVYYNFCKDYVCWLGATDENSEGQYQWITGEPFEYTNWFDDEPNNAGGKEHYLMMGNGKTFIYDGKRWPFYFKDKWNDLPNEGVIDREFDGQVINVYPVCEWDN